MKIRAGRDGGRVAALNLTSAIDTCFLLLVFFVASMRTPIIENNIPAYLPKTQAGRASTASVQPLEEKKDVNVVHLGLDRSASGELEIRLNGALLEGGFSRLDDALASLKYIAQQTPGVKTEIVLDARRLVRYEHVVRTLDLCARHGFTSVSFALPAREQAAKP